MIVISLGNLLGEDKFTIYNSHLLKSYLPVLTLSLAIFCIILLGMFYTFSGAPTISSKIIQKMAKLKVKTGK